MPGFAGLSIGAELYVIFVMLVLIFLSVFTHLMRHWHD